MHGCAARACACASVCTRVSVSLTLSLCVCVCARARARACVRVRVCVCVCGMWVQVNKVNATVVDCACITEVKELSGREVCRPPPPIPSLPYAYVMM